MGRFLLLVTVVLGVAAMHTLGHTAGSGHSGSGQVTGFGPASSVSSTEHRSARAVHQQSSPAGAPGVGDWTPVAGVPVVGVPVAGVPSPVVSALRIVVGSPPRHPGDGPGAPHLDPLSICLAVLGVWAVALLVLATLGLRPGRAGHWLAAARPVVRLGRAPPAVPVGLRTAELSVLRI